MELNQNYNDASYQTGKNELYGKDQKFVLSEEKLNSRILEVKCKLMLTL